MTAAGSPRIPAVPGYRTGRLLGFGGSGEVWAAVAEDGGEPVALKVLRLDGGPDLHRLRREAALLRRVDHPHVVRLRAVEDVPGWGPVLVLDRALGGSLGALVSARGPLDAGEVVTVLSPLAAALADLHDRGLVHGDVAPGNVLFDDRGRPLLGDLGTAGLLGVADGEVHGTPGYADPARLAGSPMGPASDVHGLAAVGWLALVGRAPGPPGERPPLVAIAPHVPAALAAVVEAGLSADPADRPDARTFAVRCYDAAPAAPVRLVPTDPGAAAAEVVTHRLRAAVAAAPADVPASSRRLSPRWPVTAAAGLLAAAAVVAGALVVPGLLGGGPASTTGAVPAAVTSAPEVSADVEDRLRGDDPLAAVPALARLRAHAFATGERSALERANVAGGDALAADLARLDELARAGVLLQGLAFEVRAATLVSRDADLAVVDTGVVTLAHRQVTADGGVVADVPAGPERTSRLVLRRGADGWRVDRLG